jgi:hypothetical protein
MGGFQLLPHANYLVGVDWNRTSDPRHSAALLYPSELQTPQVSDYFISRRHSKRHPITYFFSVG